MTSRRLWHSIPSEMRATPEQTLMFQRALSTRRITEAELLRRAAGRACYDAATQHRET